MKVVIILIVALAIWYGAIAFVANEFNPMNWNIWVKLLAVFIAFRALAKVAEESNSTF